MRLGVGAASQMIFARPGKIIWTLYLGVPQVQGLGGMDQGPGIMHFGRLDKRIWLPSMRGAWGMDQKPGTIHFGKLEKRIGLRKTSHSICGWGSCSFPNDFMRFGVGGLQNHVCKAWKNHLDFRFWCGRGSGSFPDDFMRLGVGGPPK